MSKLLHISVSPRGERSTSKSIAASFLDTYRAANPGDEIVEIDLWNYDLPEFDGDTLAAKYAVLGGGSPTGEEVTAWGNVAAIAEEFKTADKVVISVPMWNFSIPYKLKHYLDVILQPGITFGWAPDKGYFSLTPGKSALVILSSAGTYHPGSGAEAFDLASPYLELVLNFLAFKDYKFVKAAPTAADPETVTANREKARAEAIEIAGSF